MRRPGRQDILIVITSPRQVDDPRGFSPFDALDPASLVFCCFFKETAQRDSFLERLRTEAAQPLDTVADPESLTISLSEEYTRLYREGQAGEAFYLAVRWWFSARRRAFHVYRLKVGFEPFQTSCMVSFDEMDTEAVQHNLAFAFRFLEREKVRVLDSFGLGERN